MMYSYKIKYKPRLRLFYRKITVVGHKYETDQDKMICYFSDGGILEIPRWSDCHVKLGVDWMNAQKKYMEEKAGQTIPVNR